MGDKDTSLENIFGTFSGLCAFTPGVHSLFLRRVLRRNFLEFFDDSNQRSLFSAADVGVDSNVFH